MTARAGKLSVLGIDLGINAIKLVELQNDKGRPRLVTFGKYEVPLNHIQDNTWINHKDEAVAAIKELLQQTKARSRIAISALPTFEVFSALINLPPLPEKDLANAIRLEAKKVVPRPLEEMSMDWRQIGGEMPEKAKNKPEVGIISPRPAEQKKFLITAAPNTLVNAYVEIFRGAGLALHGLETEAIALSRSLIGNDPSVTMIVDIGAKTTNLSIIEHGIPVVNRGINFGGIQFSENLQKTLGVTLAEAEQWKRDQGLNNAEQDLITPVKQVLDNVLHEIKYVFQMYRRQFQYDGLSTNTIEKVVLTGGSAFVPGLANFLAESLGVPVHLGDPWARLVYPQDLETMLQELGPSMSVAIGLAMQAVI